LKRKVEGEGKEGGKRRRQRGAMEGREDVEVEGERKG
jgi:hypothetical protein